MQKWEHLRVVLLWDESKYKFVWTGGGRRIHENGDSMLTILGDEGWELVAVTEAANNDNRDHSHEQFYFKRPISN